MAIAHHVPRKHLTAEHIGAFLFSFVSAVFAYAFFYHHVDFAGHGLDICGPMAIERISAAFRLTAGE